MRLLCLAFVLLGLFSSEALAERPDALLPRDATPPDTLTAADGWLSEAIGTLNISQAAYSHWQEGGVNTLALSANLSSRFARVLGEFRQRHDSRLAYGLVRQDTLRARKALDVIRYGLDLQYTGLGHWQPTLANELRTQFAPGYDYDPDEERYPALAELIVPGERLKVSDIFSPATWTISLGMAYEPDSWFRGRGGLGAKQTIVLIDRLRPVYGSRPDQPMRSEVGLDALLEAGGELFENVHVRSRLSVFQAFTQLAEAAPDAFWENLVQMRVNRWLSVNFEFAALYDRDVLDRVQLKEVLSLGVSVTLL